MMTSPFKDIPSPTIEAKTSDGLPSQERISKLAISLFVLGRLQLPLDGQRNGRRLRRVSPHGDTRRPSAKRQGGPDPPTTKGRGLFSSSAYLFAR